MVRSKKNQKSIAGFTLHRLTYKFLLPTRCDMRHQPGRRNWIRLLSATAGTVFSYPFLASFTQAQLLLKPSAKLIPRVFFGMHIHRSDMGTPWPSVGFGSWRLWDAAVSWSRLQPQKGQWDFSRLDKYAAMGNITGVEILLPLALSPGWASARPFEQSAYEPGNAAEPADMENWRAFIRTVAKRYKGRIKHYELWNEPNHRRFFSGTPEAYLALLREANSILKAEDPSNLLVGPATTGDGKSLEWVDEFLSLGGGKYLDVLSHHFYVAHDKPETALPYMMRFKFLASKHGLDSLPLWNTETGWWIENESGRQETQGIASSWKILGAELAAAYVSRALILAWASGIERFYWYSWDHKAMGLIDPQSGRLKPAGVAYGRTLKWLEGARMLACTRTSDVWTCKLNREGVVAWLVWTDADLRREWSIPRSWSVAHVESLDGNRSMLAGRSVMVEASPILLSGVADADRMTRP
ncbi:glycosyl hydrolase [Thiobacillus sp.]|uniref:GH39 family glycosyl hydrolase n=1 Tax=Thiobacillus sp. TaxID=924 RepID=UPI0011D6481C|nr:glycosyl hydrolase [Thiobacillus sp.]TXH72935.1 MAG: hypothetical protein E6Q82_15455 [Thiobacillus sp.]